MNNLKTCLDFFKNIYLYIFLYDKYFLTKLKDVMKVKVGLINPTTQYSSAHYALVSMATHELAHAARFPAPAI